MENFWDTGFRAICIGLGATLTFDLWAQFLKLAFGIPPSNICLVGRWLRYMPEGIFRHVNIALTAAKPGECVVGWVAHYSIGITLTLAFVGVAGRAWLEHPTLIPALGFGIVTVLAPFCIMQPAFGFGVAASKTPHPGQARMRSVMNHAAFGVGLFLFAQLLNCGVK
jgi:hypothetical protein